VREGYIYIYREREKEREVVVSVKSVREERSLGER
jgi:hypothetical protein